ncbi:MAG: replication-associated recombination protein A [Clostridia bacterium]|nr:replication-associated recombination protein A [Clostridia bacterium]
MEEQKPLADRMRPRSLDEMVGQEHLLGEGKILRRLIESRRIPNMIFYGPSGTGKTTLANIIAGLTNKKFYKLNATNASVSDIKNIISELDTFAAMNGVLLYLDEIQNFNKKQQQSLLEFIENGQITLISSTTENPYFYVYNAILSRCSVFEFQMVPPQEIERAVRRAEQVLSQEFPDKIISFTPEAVTHIAQSAGGDVRKALNAAEVCLLSVLGAGERAEITLETAVEATQKKAMRYDRDGDSHYDIVSAFQKSIRGSDPDAAVHYLARLLEAGDLPSVCRRMLVTASEDIGLAYPNAIVVAKACVDAALMLGLPEARIPLTQAVLLLATAPKSNSAICAIDAAMSDLQNKDTGEIPAHLRDSHYSGSEKLGHGKGYVYPHSQPYHYVDQQYLPDAIKNQVYYYPGQNKFEDGLVKYWEEVKKKRKGD